jgi:hypothetical protein
MKGKRGKRIEPTPPLQDPANPRLSVTIALLIIGVLIWVLLGEGRGMGVLRWGIILGVGALVFITPAASNLGRVSAWLNAATPARRGRMTFLVGIVSLAYFIVTAFLQQRDLFPKTHDECSYAIGAHIIASGHLWMPEHPLADFFESFYLLTKPAYCSIYFPGTAMLFAVGVLLHLPGWIVPVLCGAGAVAALYALVCEVIDDTAGLLAAIVIVSLTWFRTFTILMMAQGPMLLAGLLILIVCLSFLKQPNWKWALLLGALMGWAAIIRPVDAIAFAISATALVIAKRKPIALIALAGMTPFFAIQLIFNVGVTSHVAQTPYTLYLQRYQPGSVIGIRNFDPSAAPQTSLPQMQKDYALSRTYLQRHTPGNFLASWLHAQTPEGFSSRPSYLAMIADTTLPARWMLILIPIGLLGLTDHRRLALAAVLPVFVGLYVLNPFFLEHYAIPLIGSIVLLLVLGMRQLSSAFPKLRFAIPAMVIATCVTGLWEVNQVIERNPAKQISDEALSSGLLRKAHDTLSGERAIVLFKFDPKGNWKAEPVYNTDVAWPDDAEVIRAHDLGSRDGELIDYYGRIQPDRALFVWNPAADQIRRIGTVGQLRQMLQAGKSLSDVLGGQ